MCLEDNHLGFMVHNDVEISCKNELIFFYTDCRQFLVVLLVDTDQLMPMLIQVRAASVTCFAGMTSGVFSSLTEDKQEFVISSAVCCDKY